MRQRDAATQVDDAVLGRAAEEGHASQPGSLQASGAGRAGAAGLTHHHLAHYIHDGARLIPMTRTATVLASAASLRDTSFASAAAAAAKAADACPVGISPALTAAGAPAELAPDPEQQAERGRPQPVGARRWRGLLADAVLRTLPLTGTVLLLVVTRVPQMRLQGLLQATEPRFLVSLGSLGDFGISSSLVVQLMNIGRTSNPINWTYQLLYIPSILPFVVMSAVTLLVHRRGLRSHWTAPFREAGARVAGEAHLGSGVGGLMHCAPQMHQGGAGVPVPLVWRDAEPRIFALITPCLRPTALHPSSRPLLLPLVCSARHHGRHPGRTGACRDDEPGRGKQPFPHHWLLRLPCTGQGAGRRARARVCV